MSEAFIRGGDSVGNHARTLLRRVPLFAALTIAPLGLLSVAHAMNSHNGPSASPFIVDESPQSKSFSAVTTHFGKRNPFFLSTNQSTVAKDSHCGIVINTDGQPGLSSFDRLSFWYKGSPETRAFVTYKPSAGSFITSFLTINEGKSGHQSKDGYKEVIFDKSLWGIKNGSSIKEIAIVPPPQKEAGAFKVDGISLDASPVRKILATIFFPPNVGPAGLPPQVSAILRKLAAGQTGVVLYNNSGVDVYAWVQLAGMNVDTTFKPFYGELVPLLAAGGPKPIKWNYPGNLPNGQPNKTFGYALIPATSGGITYSISSIASPGQWSGNVTFTPVSSGTSVIPTTNCPSATYPCGHNQAEWSLNNGPAAGESANMSCNNGVNSQVTMNYSSNGSGSPPSPTNCTSTSPSPCWTISATSGSIYPPSVQNSLTLTSNNNLPGVYPFNCPCCGEPTCASGTTCNFLYPGYAPPACTGSPNNSCTFPFSGPPITNWGANTNQSCQVGRANGVSGGTINITVNGFNVSCQ